jgi:transcriptional regulator with XRE-family HTH domain
VSRTDLNTEIRDFLSTRRARITPEQAGLPAYGGNRRVKGLRREEVAMLAGVSVDYYIRMERGGLAGASESVLDALADALRLDEAERTHLFALARESGARGNQRKRTAPASVRPAIQQVLDAMTDAPAWVRNGRHDIVAMNSLARALYSPVLADPRRPANTTRFVYLDPEAAQEFFVDYDRIANDAASMLRLEAGRNPHDKALIELSASCPLARSCSGGGGPSTTSRSTAADRSGCVTPWSVSSTSTSKGWSSPRRRGSTSTSTRPPLARRPPTR